ncbi:MAG: hypothetical protein RLZZ488_2432 [Pseudomonadota bacterium]
MIKTFHAQGFLLAEHSVYENLARLLLDDSTPAAHKRWSVVCERKEDLLAVRAQIFALLNKIHREKKPDEELRAWAGISLYTPDTLVRNIALTLSNNSALTLGQEIYEQLRRPFTDVVEQEKLVRLLLLRLGYSLSDVAPLAKQILTLADTPLPADESFLNLLLEVQNSPQGQKSIGDIPDCSLRTICVAFQLAQKILGSFGRLQSFVGNYWSPHFHQHLEKFLEQDPLYQDFLLPVRFLSEPLLWVAAPEFCKDKNSSYRPGNFQAAFIDSLRDGLFSARSKWTEHRTASGITWWARTQIPTAQILPEVPHAKIEILGSYAALSHRFESDIRSSGAETQFLLGDIDKRLLNTVRADGSGVHSLTPADFLPQKEMTEACNGADAWQTPAQEKVAQLREEFQSYWDKLHRFDNLIGEALAMYDLSPSLREHGVSFELMLHRFFDSESFNFANTDLISQLPPALSLLAGVMHAQKFVVLGPPHSQTAPSFHLRLLNSVFHLLRSRQVAIDPIASEESYRGYWQSILNKDADVVFLMRSHRELKDFPADLRRWCLPPVEQRMWSDSLLRESAFLRWLGSARPFQLQDENWPRLLKESARKGKINSLSVTAFEDYVECPLQFYWVGLHGLGQDAQPVLQPDALITGQKAHAMAEKLIRGLRQICLLEQTESQRTENSWLHFFVSLHDNFLDTELFLSTSADEWLDALTKSLNSENLSQTHKVHVRALLVELTEVIFSGTELQGDSALSPLRQRLVRETVRRAMRKLIQSELHDAGASLQQSDRAAVRKGLIRAAFVEQPVDFLLHGELRLTGRIDRVDTHPEGDRIIDYKTSKVAKKDPALVIDPRMVKTTNKLSVQGGIYSLAWARKIAEERGQGEASDGRRNAVAAFSLLRLKTMDMSREPYATFAFEEPMSWQDESCQTLHTEYARYGQSLSDGDFSPRPITASLCTWCTLNSICPAKGQSGGEPA